MLTIRVKELAKSEVFYRDVLGLEEGLRDERRPWLFLRAGGQDGMIVLQEDKGEWPRGWGENGVKTSYLSVSDQSHLS